MALKPLIAQDEAGQRWIVYEGDAAWDAARKLHLHGVREIVLPRPLLRYGKLTEVEVDAILDRISGQSVTNVALAPLLRRYLRLADCVAFLKAEVDHRTSRLEATDTEGEAPPVG